MRVGEALNLDLEDVDLDHGVLTIRNSKFGKSRLVPVHATTCAVLKLYLEQRNAFLAGRIVRPFFISPLGRRITHSTLSLSFRRLSRKLGLRGISDARAGFGIARATATVAAVMKPKRSLTAAR